MPRQTHHVVPGGSGGGWNIKKGGAARASKHFAIKATAIDYARQISVNQQSELLIHGKEGRIQRSDSHGQDPCPPKDKK